MHHLVGVGVGQGLGKPTFSAASTAACRLSTISASSALAMDTASSSSCRGRVQERGLRGGHAWAALCHHGRLRHHL